MFTEATLDLMFLEEQKYINSFDLPEEKISREEKLVHKYSLIYKIDPDAPVFKEMLKTVKGRDILNQIKHAVANK